MLRRVSRWWLPVVVVTLLWSFLAAASVYDKSRLSGLIRHMLPLGGGSHPQQSPQQIVYQRVDSLIVEVASVDVPLPPDATPYDGVYVVQHGRWGWNYGFWAATQRRHFHTLSVITGTADSSWLPEELRRELIARFKTDAVSRGMLMPDLAACIDQDGRNCVVREPYWPGIALNVAWAASIGLIVLRVRTQMANRKGPNSK